MTRYKGRTKAILIERDFPKKRECGGEWLSLSDQIATPTTYRAGQDFRVATVPVVAAAARIEVSTLRKERAFVKGVNARKTGVPCEHATERGTIGA